MEVNNVISLTNIYTQDWTEAEIDRIYEETIQSIKLALTVTKVKHDYDPSLHGLLRSGFVAYMIRVAIERFYLCKIKFFIKKDGETEDPIEALNMFMAILMKSADNAREEYEVKRHTTYHTPELNDV